MSKGTVVKVHFEEQGVRLVVKSTRFGTEFLPHQFFKGFRSLRVARENATRNNLEWKPKSYEFDLSVRHIDVETFEYSYPEEEALVFIKPGKIDMIVSGKGGPSDSGSR